MIEQPLTLPVLLTRHHETDGFDCGKAPLNEFLIKYALYNQAGGGAEPTYSHAAIESSVYYSLAPAAIAPEDAPPARVIKGHRRYTCAGDPHGAVCA